MPAGIAPLSTPAADAASRFPVPGYQMDDDGSGENAFALSADDVHPIILTLGRDLVLRVERTRVASGFVHGEWRDPFVLWRFHVDTGAGCYLGTVAEVAGDVKAAHAVIPVAERTALRVFADRV